MNSIIINRMYAGEYLTRGIGGWRGYKFTSFR